MKFILISDFHLSRPGEALWGLNPHERVERCLADIARWHGDAAFCVICGDIAETGDPTAYGWLADRLDAFPLRTFLMAGNHDDRAALLAAFPGHARDEHGFLQCVHETDAGAFLFLDTVKGPVSEGAYCARRRAWLESRLEEAGDRPVWLFMHHPPFDIGIPRMDRIKLEDAEAFARVIASHGDIRHIFFGHVHRAVFVHWRGIPCASLPGTAHQVPLEPASVGDAPLSVEPAMYAIVRIDGEQTTVLLDAPLDRAPLRAGGSSKPAP